MSERMRARACVCMCVMVECSSFSTATHSAVAGRARPQAGRADEVGAARACVRGPCMDMHVRCACVCGHFVCAPAYVSLWSAHSAVHQCTYTHGRQVLIAYAYVQACTHVLMHMRMCRRARTFSCICICAGVHASSHAYAYVQACTHVIMHLHMCRHARTFSCICVCAGVQACCHAYAYVQVCRHVLMHMRMCRRARMFSCICVCAGVHVCSHGVHTDEVEY